MLRHSERWVVVRGSSALLVQSVSVSIVLSSVWRGDVLRKCVLLLEERVKCFSFLFFSSLVLTETQRPKKKKEENTKPSALWLLKLQAFPNLAVLLEDVARDFCLAACMRRDAGVYVILLRLQSEFVFLQTKTRRTGGT